MSFGTIRWILAGLALCACGCGGATVSGKVTYQGRPVTSGSVIILGADRQARSGVIEADGSYAVEGVTPGEVKIGVVSHDPAKGRHQGKKPPPPRGTWFPLPPRYEDPETSGLGCTVGGGQVRHDIELTAGK